jgi:probable F420-dependent oxidoreductase
MARLRRFRFGLNCVTTSLGAWQEAARKAEALGFDTLIAQDHLGAQLAPLPALVAAAAVTSRLRLATLVLDNDFRHPAVLAKEAATVDVLSQGRLELGLGAGWLESDYTSSGIPFDPPTTRLARLAETIQICKGFFAEAESLSFRGAHYQIEQLATHPRPVQRPRPPIMVGGRLRRALSLAGREADIVSISLLDRRGPGLPEPPTFDQKLGWVREAAGARFPEIELHVNASVDLTSHAEPPAAPGRLVGSVEAIVEQLLAHREQYGLSYYVIRAAALDAFAPVVARLHGK